MTNNDADKIDLDKWEPMSKKPSPNRQLFRRHAVDFEAVRFTGDNFDELRKLTGVRISPSTLTEIQVFNPIGTYLLPSEKHKEAKGELWIDEDRLWRPVYVGDWIVQQDQGWLSVTDEWLSINCVRLDEEMLALIREEERPKTFLEDLQSVLNYHSQENLSGTPDFILANYLHRCLEAYNATIMARAEWRGESVELQTGQVIVRQADGKEVPLVIYTDNQRNEIGTAKIEVTPGEVRVTGTITGVVPMFGKDSFAPPAYSIGNEQISLDLDVPKDEPLPEDKPPSGKFERYIQKGLSDNG